MAETNETIAKTVLYHLAQGRLDKAQAEHARLNQEDPLTVAVSGDLALAEGRPQDAFACWMRAAEMFQRAGQPDRVLFCQQRVVRLDAAGLDDTARARHRLLTFLVPAEEKLAAGDLEGAAAAFQETVRANPNHTVAYQRLATVLARLGRVPEAVEQYLTVGRAFLGHKLAAKARPYYERAAELAPRNAEALAGLAAIVEEAGEGTRAGGLRVAAAETAIQQGDLAMAADMIRRLQEAGDPEALYLLGVLALKEGRKDEAKAALGQFVRKARQYSKALMQVGQLFEAEGRPELALTCYRRAAVTGDAVSPQAQASAVAVEAALRTRGQAVPPAVGGEPLAGSDAEAELARVAAERLDRLTITQPLAALSAQSGPLVESDLTVLLTMGEMCLAEEMFDEAKQIYERVLRSRPGSEEAFDNLNKARLGLGLPPLRVPTGVNLTPTRQTAPTPPARHTQLPHDPLDYLEQLQRSQAAPKPAAAPVPPSLPPLPPLPGMPAMPPRPEPVPELELAAVASTAAPALAAASAPMARLAGELAERVQKARITRHTYEISCGEVPPPRSGGAAFDDDIIE